MGRWWPPRIVPLFHRAETITVSDVVWLVLVVLLIVILVRVAQRL